MLHHRRFLFVFLSTVASCAIYLIAWQNAHTESPLRRITNTTEEGINTNPSISGDGRIVGFESTEDITDAGGSETFRALRANVSVDPATFLQIGATRAPAPALSQDGSRIAFASKDNPLGANNDANSEIFLYDGARLIQVTNTSPGDLSDRVRNGNFQPSISDDGRFIAFSSNRDLAGENADGNFEVFVYDTVALSFTQLTNSSGILGATDAKISGNGAAIAYIRDTGTVASADRDLLLQNRVGPTTIRTLATNAPQLATTYGRAISDDGARVVWSAQTATNTTQVFLFDGRNNNTTRQITTLSSRATDVPLHPGISGDGSRISFATRRAVPGQGNNSDGSVELYTFDLPSGTFGRVTNVNNSGATAEVVSSLNDDGALIAFNFSRLLSGPVSHDSYENDSEIYLSSTPPRPASRTINVLNRASFGHEPAATKAVAPESMAIAVGGALAFTTEQPQRLPDATFPTTVAGTSVTVNGLPAQIFFVSPNEVHFHVPAATALGTAEVVVTNSDGFQSRGSVTTLRAAPGVFTKTGDGLGEGTILNADTLQPGPFDPTNGNLRFIVFSTGVRNATTTSVSAGGRALTLESMVQTTNLPGMDELHVLVPADLRGVGKVDLVLRADGRDSNPATVEFSGNLQRDVLINEFLADPPGAAGTDLAGDANRDGTRSSSDDEFIELVNTTTHDIDISSYRIFTRGTGSDTLRQVFEPGTILRSCSAIVVFGGATAAFNPNDPAFRGALVVKASTGSLSLVNSGGVITLQDQSSAIVNLVAYGGSAGFDADNDQSVTRSPDLMGNFAQHLTASNGARAFSPGTQITGAAFTSCTPAIARVEVSPPSAAIEVTAQKQFTARAFDAGSNEIPGVIFFWQSTAASVATIDQNGLATGVSPGSTEIRATGHGVTSPPVLLTINPPVPVLTSVAISPAAATIGAGDTQQFTAQAKDQTGQNIGGGVTITFASNNAAVATVDSVGPTSADGSATATITGRGRGSAEIRASANNGSFSVNSSPATLTVEPGAGDLLISEFRTRGPAGAADEFIEIYNPTTSVQTIGGLKIRASNGSGTISDRLTITAGTTLGPGCHYLVANSAANGYSGPVSPNQTYGAGITDDGGIAITGSNGARIIDAAGMSSGSAYKEGATLAPLTGPADQSYERKPGGSFGNGVDTNGNASDFSLTAPGNPQNSSSGCLDTTSADLSIAITDAPDPVTIGSNVTYTLTITNNGAAVAQAMTVTDNLPPAVTFVSCNSSAGGVCGGSGNNLGNNRTVTFASLGSGASATVTLVAMANGPAETVISNTASVSSTTADANPANNSATATTLVQSPLPLLSLNDVTADEGNSGSTTFTFTVSLAAPAPAAVTFDIATQNNTATAASGDYVAMNLFSQMIPAGQQIYTVDVTVNSDTLVEPDETFFVNVTNISGATAMDTQGQGTIRNDDTANLVVSQVYGGGGNTGAQFRNDFVEIFNRGAASVNFAATPYSVQYAGATAAFGSGKVDLTTRTIAPGQYFLVQLSGGAIGAPLPTPDAAGSIAMAATAGKVALVSGTVALSGSACPLSTTVADFVGYGTAADCLEGSGRAPAPGNITADLRKAGGCTDSNDNGADFFTTVPFPRNTSSPTNNCITGAPPNLTINDVTVVEGNSGTTIATFTVRLSAPAAATDITFDIATADGSAQDNNPAANEDNDYVARALTNQIIPAGQQSYTFSVNINGDSHVEANETFFVNLTNVAGATLTDGQGLATIENDDLPSLAINDVSQNETNSGATTFSFNVSLSAPAPTAGVTFAIATADNSATVADNDYVARMLSSQHIPAGSSTYTFAVTVNGDLLIEPNESFLVNISDVSGAVVADPQGLGTIQNDDSPTLSVSDVSQAETNNGATTFTFTVSSSLPAPAGGITFDIATADGSAQDDTPTSEDNDYAARSLTGQTIPAGSTTYTFAVTVNGDTLVEPDEMFVVNLSNVANAAVLDGQGQGTIQNDDTPLLVISQVYGGGGNSGATYTNDFIELFNRGATTIDFSATPYSVQYAAATSNFATNKTDITSGVLLPGQYFLIREGSGGAVGAALPTPDLSTGTINLAATAGKVALVSGTAALTGSGCPLSATIVDFLGYGSTATCFETAPLAVSGTNANARSVVRSAGCTDSNNNAVDFSNPVTAPVARNKATPPTTCP
jgi:uncharacterized protein (TIGR03437 family)